jgi:hypothetical protein
MPVWPRVRSAIAGLSEPAQRGGVLAMSSVVPGRPSARVRNRPLLAGLVRMGPGWRGPARPACCHRCCQMRTLSKSARARPRQCPSILPPDLWAAKRR